MVIKITTLGAVLLSIVCLSVVAEDYPIELEAARIHTHDIASIQRGAHAFVTYCMVCHSLEYMIHDPIAKSAGIIASRMPKKDQKWWFGASPPDLSLIAKVHSPDWLYTYLHTFYKDTSRMTGTNNLLMDNVNMPDPFIGLQGVQVLLVKKSSLFANWPPFTQKLPYYSVLKLTSEGSMSPDDFDKLVRDIVTFLDYASDPKKYAREMLGFWVLIFLGILFVLVYSLRRDYWKRIKK